MGVGGATRILFLIQQVTYSAIKKNNHNQPLVISTLYTDEVQLNK